MPLGRAERLLLLTVGGLLATVVVAIARAPRPRPPATHALADSSVAADGPAVIPQGEERGTAGMTHDAVSPSHTPPPERDTAEIRVRIMRGAERTYLLDMLADADWWIVRWPDRRTDGLRVWVRDATDLADWNPAYAAMGRDAFGEWASVGSPLRFVFVLDSASADIRLTWIDRFPPAAGRQIGNTERQRDQYGWLATATITVAIHNADRRPFTPDELAGIVRHEVGHALGLGHSRDPASMMYPEERVHQLATVDRETLRLVYTLPPGSVKGMVR